MSSYVFFNNQFVPGEKALIHFRDLSIQRGYGVFDFFKVVNSIPVFLDDHLKRFYSSAKEMRLNVGYSKEELEKIIFELFQKNSVRDTGVRISLTGGYSIDEYDLSKPNLIVALRPFNSLTKEQFAKGIKLITYEHQRQLPHVKTIDYLMAIWLQPFIKQYNADDVLYHQSGIVSECPRSNFFIVTKENVIVTPSENILKGVMRSKLIEIVAENFKVEERPLTIEEIKTAKEAFITSTTKIILPVRQIDEHFFPEENSITLQLYNTLLQLQTAFTKLHEE